MTRLSPTKHWLILAGSWLGLWAYGLSVMAQEAVPNKPRSTRSPVTPQPVASVPAAPPMVVDGNTVYRCALATGGVIYTNEPKPADIKSGQCKAVSTPNVSVVPGNPVTASQSSPAFTPKTPEPWIKTPANGIPPALQAAREALQRESETRLGNERNYQNYLDRVQPFQDRVNQLERSYGLPLTPGPNTGEGQ